MLAFSLIPALLARKARSRPTSVPVFHNSLFPVEGSEIFMLIYLDLYLFLAVIIIIIIIMLDWTTRWHGIVPLSSISATSVVLRTEPEKGEQSLRYDERSKRPD